MKKLFPVFFALMALAFFLAKKNIVLKKTASGTNPLIVGANCRITKIAYIDSATNTGIGSFTVIINAADNTTEITKFDSLGLFVEFNAMPVYVSDTVAIRN